MLKIRLQLQIHSLSDPLDAARKARYGTVATFRNILRDEGVTVCVAPLMRVFPMADNNGAGAGLLER